MVQKVNKHLSLWDGSERSKCYFHQLAENPAFYFYLFCRRIFLTWWRQSLSEILVIWIILIFIISSWTKKQELDQMRSTKRSWNPTDKSLAIWENLTDFSDHLIFIFYYFFPLLWKTNTEEYFASSYYILRNWFLSNSFFLNCHTIQ